jgi:CxxC motif-containing protein
MKELTCIVCPVGCHLMAEDEDHVTGNRCPRGLVYAKAELTDPKRMVTSTVKTNHPLIPRLSVKTDKPISKALVFKAIDELCNVTITKDIRIGDVVIAHVLGTDVDIIATKDILY